MKRKIKLFSLAIATIIMIGSCFIYMACEKSPSSILPSTKKEKPENIEIAFFDTETNEISLTFDRDIFEKMFSPVVDSLLGNDFVYEYISVVDDDVWGNKDFPALQISFFNIDEGASYNLFWFDIYKSIEDGGVRYYMKGKTSGTEGWTFVICKSKECPEGCKKDGKKCSPCPPSNDPNVKPSCERTEKEALEVLCGPIATIIGALIGLFGILHKAQ